MHQHHRRLERVARPVGTGILVAGREDRPAPSRVELTPDPLPARTPAGEFSAQQRRIGGDRHHHGPESVCQPHPVGPAGLRTGVEIHLHRRGRRHHGRARDTGVAGREELFHRRIARARIDALGRPQRVRAQRHQTQAGGGEGFAQHGLVVGDRLDRGRRTECRRAGKLYRAAGLDGDHAATRHRRKRLQNLGDFIPGRPTVWVSRVVAMRLDLEADPPYRPVRQTGFGDVLRRSRRAGKFAVRETRGIQLRRDGKRHNPIPSAPRPTVPSDRARWLRAATQR